MRRSVIAVILFLFLRIPAAEAQSIAGDGSSTDAVLSTQYLAQKGETTSAVDIAMLYYKMTGYVPDYQQLVEESPMYKRMKVFEQLNMIQTHTKELQRRYEEIDIGKPIVINLILGISGFDIIKGAFTMPSFNPELFYEYRHMGKNYAVIPSESKDYKAIVVSRRDRLDFYRQTRNGKWANAQVFLVPVKAHVRSTMVGDAAYSVISVKVGRVIIWSEDNTRVLWDSSGYDKKNKAVKKDPLMDLYQNQ